MRDSSGLLPLVALLLLSPPARADDIQVSLDQMGKVQEVTAERARGWSVLTEYPGLTEARLYQDSASGVYTLEVTEDRDGRRVRRRVSLSKESVESLRGKISARLAEHATPTSTPVPGPGAAPLVGAQPAAPTPAPGPGPRAAGVVGSRSAAPTLNQEGRWVLVALSTAMGASYYGLAISYLPSYLAPRSPYPYYGPYYYPSYSLHALTTAASFFAPLLLTMNQEVTWGATAAFYAGITRGIGHGLLLGASLLPDSELMYPYPLLLIGTVVGLAEGIGAAHWAARKRLSAGLVHSAMTGADFGAAYGFGIHALVGGSAAMQGRGMRWVALSTLAGSVLGTVGGYVSGHKRGYSWGAAEAIRTTGLLGAFVTVPVLAWTQQTDVRVFSGAMLGGSMLGLAVGDQLFADRNYGVGEALLLDLGVVAGCSLGLAVANISGLMSGYVNPGPTFTLAALGAVGGYVLTYIVLPGAPSAERAAAPSVRLHVDPMALAAQLPGGARVPGLSGFGSSSMGPGTIPSVVSVSGDF
jgi:hypothetical protein